MNLLFVIHSLSSGGAERATASLANHWASKGWQVTVVTIASKNLDFYKLHPEVRRIGLNLAKESAHPLTAIVNNLCRILALRKVLHKYKPNVALAMMSSANILLSLAVTGIKGIATVGSERTHPPQLQLGPIWEVMRTYFYGRLTTVTALTQESAVWLRNHTRAREVVVIPNATTWPLPKIQPRLELPVMQEGQQLLLAVGRLNEEKRFDLLISLFQRLAEDFPNWILLILGEGPDRKSLEKQVQSAGLAGRILLPGRAGNISQWYEAADLYVMTSRFEGFPNTLAEAMAHGLAAVSFDCDTGPRDIIRHEVDGLLVPTSNIESLEDALRKMMKNTLLRQQFSERAIEVRERFSLEKVTGMWEQLFEEITP